MYPKTHKTATRILKLNGITNGKFDYKQERAVRKLFLKNKFIEECRYPIAYRSMDDWISNGCPLCIEENHFIQNPFGATSHPDFLSRENDTLFWWECKSSSTDGKVQLNTTLPVKGVFYIITLKSKTTITLGERILTDDERDKFIPWLEKVYALNEEAPNVPGVRARLRVFYEISNSRRFVYDGYGDKCTKEVLDILNGKIPAPPVKHGEFFVEPHTLWNVGV